jgi:hypothetical protein
MNQWKVLHASAAVDTPATSDNRKNFLGMQQFSILAWANTHPEDRDYLNKNNAYFWPKLNACKNKPDARLVIETEMFQPLLRRNPKLINCLHDELKETIVNRIQAIIPLTGLAFGVIFLRGHISLKNRS